nr:hypothetical protein [Tanacetum cinerariifolium]
MGLLALYAASSLVAAIPGGGSSALMGASAGPRSAGARMRRTLCYHRAQIGPGCGELWRTLLGLDQLIRWRVEQTTLAESLRPRWAIWARVYIGNARNAGALTGFLARPAAVGMVLKGLSWFARLATYRQPTLRYWDTIADSLADLLFCAWRLPADALRQEVVVFEPFKQLLGALVARQPSLGLHLN